jgi:predicted ATPase
MLTGIEISDFKCFESLALPLAPLTVLTGFNAAGKSSSIQGILLLGQCLRLRSNNLEIPLNGSLVRLGTPGEVVNSGAEETSFTIMDESTNIEWGLTAEDRNNRNAMSIRHIIIKSELGEDKIENPASVDMLLPVECAPGPKKLLQDLSSMIFLSAVRMGTADYFPSPDTQSLVHADVGTQGEFAPWWFHRYMDEEIAESRRHSQETALNLRRQFNAWAGEIFPGAQANAQRIDRTDLIRLELRIGDSGEWRRPSNIGYGLTYAFPIIVSGLLAKPGQLLIVDSPEAHLHPLGQSKIGAFLAKIAADGVQVIIETHSDHVINGIRLSTLQEVIRTEQVQINFFDRKEVYSPPNVSFIKVKAGGDLSEWPDGFLDQEEQDLAELFRLKKL